MSVFLEQRRQHSSSQLLRDLRAEVEAIVYSAGDRLINLLESVLLRAGELDCAINDIDSQGLSAAQMAQVTDLMAEALLAPDLAAVPAGGALKICCDLDLPADLHISPPEGFCFYALHPLDYVELLEELPIQTRPVMVVGIRSIGTTLSAVVSAALRKRNSSVPVARVTVRPEGHPYNRTARFDAGSSALIRQYQALDAIFMVVDEGPGLSGSSFLSVGEALHAQGVPFSDIIFLTSHQVDPDSLVSDNGAERWRRFRSYATRPTTQVPADADREFGGGDWRREVFAQDESYSGTSYSDPICWPAQWAQTVSRKYVSRDGATLFKYEGLGRFGASVRERASTCAEAGFGVPVRAAAHGFNAYELTTGRLMSAADITPSGLQRMAQYLAFRASAFAAVPDTKAQEQMTCFNYSQLVGGELSDFTLEVERPVVADGRMHPHEWLLPAGGTQMIKLDLAAHGDNHFFPGPTDIAWDVAGAIAEWEMNPAQTECLISAYERASGDLIRGRLRNYAVAYCAFQAGFAQMALSSTQCLEEARRLERDAKRYRSMLVAAANQVLVLA